MRFSIKDFFSAYDQILSLLRICSHLLKKALMENFMFFAVQWIKVVNYFCENLCLSSEPVSTIMHINVHSKIMHR